MQDHFLDSLAKFALRPIDSKELQDFNYPEILLDSFAVALGAVDHDVVQKVQRFATANGLSSEGAVVWGTSIKASLESAILCNGAALRAYDFNDVYISRSGGHPSDMVPGLIALAETRGLSGARLTESLYMGYRVSQALMDAFNIKPKGWDYPTIVAIAATAAACRMLGLSESQTRGGLGITATCHFASYEVESSELDDDGNLSSWKRLNAANAVALAMRSALLAEAGLAGAVRPFEGKHGYLAKVGMDESTATKLAAEFASGQLPAYRKSTFKRWPVGSRGQSAIQAAIQAHATLEDVDQVAEVTVETGQDVFDHMVGIRETAWSPKTRETADHSLPFIVASALVHGSIGPGSFDPANFVDDLRVMSMLAKTRVVVCDEFHDGAVSGFLSRVNLTTYAGEKVIGEALPPPGHPLNPLNMDQQIAKLNEAVHGQSSGVTAEVVMQGLAELCRPANEAFKVRHFTEMLLSRKHET